MLYCLRDAEEGLVAAIVAASKRGSWQASAWLLERSNPDRWARPSPRQQTGGSSPTGPVADVFAEVDELAEQRRRRAGGVPSRG